MSAKHVGRQVAIFFVVALVLYAETAWSMVSIWMRSDTFAHGFLILPIALWLVWDQRVSMLSVAYRETRIPLLLMIPLGSLWLLASLVDVQVVQQFALVSILVVGTWSIVGHEAAARMAFPLGFLFLAVPMGEGLVPPMMELTATSTVWLIKLTGIPVYREGLYFALPSGNWSVVAACSGVRYLIASFTLGLLYAHLSYNSLRKRLLFVAASLLVPVLANIARAYGIVMLGHFSNMQLATGVDHLVYGWLFFGIVMFLLFWIGSFSRDKSLPQEPAKIQQPQLTRGRLRTFWVALLLAVVWPGLALLLERAPSIDIGLPLVGPAAEAGWLDTNINNWEWIPLDTAADQELIQGYQRGASSVTLYLQQHLGQRQGEELVASGNRFSDTAKEPRITSNSKLLVTMGSQELQIDAVVLATATQTLRIWGWYRIGEYYTASPYIAKIAEVAEKLRFGRQDSARIYLAVEMHEGVDSDKILHDFVSAHLDTIEATLDRTIKGAGDE
ncbi:MAG: exosortase A [Halioglobus sp.]|jgi:exosortase A